MADSKKIVKKEFQVPSEPKKFPYEFFGPIGTSVLSIFLGPLIYATVVFCNDVSGCPAPSLLHPSTLTWQKLKAETPWPANGVIGLFDLNVISWSLAYLGLLVLLQLVLPGEVSPGTKLANGKRHMYKFNSFNTAVLIIGGAGVGTFVQGTKFPLWPFIWNNYLQIITTWFVISISLATYVYVRSFSVPGVGQPNPTNRELAPGGTSGNIAYDWFMGRELNPRIDIPSSIPLIGGETLDIKVFFELRPGMIGYILLNLAFCVHQYEAHGYLSDSIILVTLFQAFYTLDGIFMEPAILTTMDIILDGFGFMLSFGDLIWLPFLYSLPARYLAVYPVHLGISGIAGVLAIQGFGFWIFRSTNNEKNRFRTDPNDPRVAHLQYIETQAGSRLITSGWWGKARHINYLGDWIMGWSYCLPTGLAGYLIHERTTSTLTQERVVEQGAARGWGTIFTYFYLVYFAVLLVYRERRDEEKCRKKYGKDWDRYTSIVKSRIVPGIY